jgi:NitT/TauT family transport system ATP-binding protein
MPSNTNLNSVIVFERVSKVYEHAKAPALKNVSFSVGEGEFVCIIGPSGGGKSTVLKIIAGLEKESSGVVKKPDNVSMVFQSGALLPWLNVFENVAIGLRAKNLPKEKIRSETFKYIDMVGLSSVAFEYPKELSGGQRQRVGVARALAVDPAVLLLDEPFSSLDPKTTEELHKDIISIWKETKKTIVMVSHLIEEAVSLADRVILMKNFEIAEVFQITLPRPRWENEAEFAREVLSVRRAFFK